MYLFSYHFRGSFRGPLGVKVNLKNKGFYPPINTHFAPFDQLFNGGLHCWVGDICACCFAFSSILNSDCGTSFHVRMCVCDVAVGSVKAPPQPSTKPAIGSLSAAWPGVIFPSSSSSRKQTREEATQVYIVIHLPIWALFGAFWPLVTTKRFVCLTLCSDSLTVYNLSV